MIDPQNVEAIPSWRSRRDADQLAAANATVGLRDEWEEVPCHDLSALADSAAADAEFQLRRRVST